MYSRSRSPLPPTSPPDPSGSSQCTRPKHLSHASNLPALRFTYQLMKSPHSFQVAVSELSVSKTLLTVVSHLLPTESSLNRFMTSFSGPHTLTSLLHPTSSTSQNSYCFDLHVQIPKYFSYPCYHHPGLSHPHFLPRLLLFLSCYLNGLLSIN